MRTVLYVITHDSMSVLGMISSMMSMLKVFLFYGEGIFVLLFWVLSENLNPCASHVTHVAPEHLWSASLLDLVED